VVLGEVHNRKKSTVRTGQGFEEKQTSAGRPLTSPLNNENRHDKKRASKNDRRKGGLYATNGLHKAGGSAKLRLENSATGR